MKIGFWKNTITLFFLSAFLFLRVADLHAYAHISDNDTLQNCELCDFITHSNQSTILGFGPDPVDNLVFDVIFTNPGIEIGNYTSPFIKTLHSDFFHNKPPPVTIF